MSSTSLLAANVPSQGAGATLFYPMGFGYSQNSATEASANTPYREAGTLSNLYCNMSANDRATSTLTSRKASSAGNQTVSITGSTTGEFEDVTNNDSVSAGDLIDSRIVTGAGGTTFVARSLRFLYSTTGVALTQRCISTALTALTTAINSLQYYPMAGLYSPLQPNQTEQNMQLTARASCTLANLFMRVNVNARADTQQILSSRINSGAGNLTISSVASTTGIFEDSTHTDSVSSGDKLNTKFVLGTSANNWNHANAGISITTTGTQLPAFHGTGRNNAGSTIGYIYVKNATYFPNFSSNNETAEDTTESLDKQKAGIAFTSSRLQANSGSNGITATSTFRFRISGVDGNQVFTIASSTSGTFEDTTHTDAVAATDQVNFSFVVPNNGSNITLQAQGSMMDITSASGPAVLYINQGVEVH